MPVWPFLLRVQGDSDYFLAAIWARSRSSCSRSSGVNASPKSSASNTWRISISDSPAIGLGQRFTHSIASSFDFTWISQKPAISSLVSANGPSMTVRLLPGEPDAGALRAGLQPLAREHHAGLHQLLVELAHLGEQLLARQDARLGLLGGLDDHHEPHRNSP